MPKITGSPDWLPQFTQIMAVKLLLESSNASVSASEPVSFTNAPLGMFTHLPTMPLFSSVGAFSVEASGVTRLPATTLAVVESSKGI